MRGSYLGPNTEMAFVMQDSRPGSPRELMDSEAGNVPQKSPNLVRRSIAMMKKVLVS